MNQPATGSTDKLRRLDAYIDFFQSMKERGTLRQVVVREMMLEMIRVNQPHINEFPLLETQQNSVIALLTPRETEHRGHQLIRGYIERFLLLLNQYEKIKDGKDGDAIKQLQTDIFNTETLLIKCVQGVVYVTCLIIDDFSDVIIRYFGENSVQQINEFTKAHPFNDSFWKAQINFFIVDGVERAYAKLIENKRYRISRGKSLLLLAFSFDDLQDFLCARVEDIQKTRIQELFAENRKDPYKRRIQSMLMEYIQENGDGLYGEQPDRRGLEYITRIISLDPLGEQFAIEYAKSLGLELTPGEQAATVVDESLASSSATPSEGEETEERHAARIAFLMDLVQTMAVGVTISQDLITDDFMRAQNNLEAREQTLIRQYIGQFEPESFDRAFIYIMQCHFMALLRKKSADESKRVHIRATSIPRVSMAAVDALSELGLSRIQRKKLFEPDPKREDKLLFKARVARELDEFIRLFQIGDNLALELRELFASAESKTDFMVGIDLNQLARVTTNLKSRLAKIFEDFGIYLTQPPQEE